MTSSLPTCADTDVHTEEKPSTLGKIIEHAAHFLPAQGPIEVFVHHNTLHAFEQQSFHDALKNATSRYHAEPYLTEAEFRQLYVSGRFTDEDLEAAVAEAVEASGDKCIGELGTRTELRQAMLRHPLHIGTDAELKWIVAETDALDRFCDSTTRINRTRIITSARKWLNDNPDQSHSNCDVSGTLNRLGRHSEKWTADQSAAFSLHLLWRICLNGASEATTIDSQSNFVRRRDLLLHSTGMDIDLLVHDVLIRFCAAYVDQGYSDWLLPNRDRGFFESFVDLYSKRSRGLDRWLHPLAHELQRLQTEGVSAEQSIEESLVVLNIADEDRVEFITQTMLSLGGWAGMIWQLESGVDWVVHAIPQRSLIGMMAVQLILEGLAIRHVGSETFDKPVSVPGIIEAATHSLTESVPLNLEKRAFLMFQVSQMLGWTPLELLQLSTSGWCELNAEIHAFGGMERRQMFQEAFERKYRHAALDAFAAHARLRRERTPTAADRPRFQMLTCIDDREESFRRHLEEVQPECETFGAAGFFAVAIYYQGAADGFYKPLCPAVIKPAHYVQEDVGYSFEGTHQSRAELRRRLGLATHVFHTRSRTFLGGMFAGIVGSLATVPLVARVLFPHLTARIRRRFGSLLQPPPVTKLQLERYASDPGPTDGHVGYSTDEMADVVVRLLQDIGLTESRLFSRLFLVCGHGSSSLNNPHESAYCCGACAGKRGGPNARAFAQMANDWRVRTKVSTRGIVIPEDTVFVGAYHNTCDDSVVFYDLDRLPPSHREDFESARTDIEEARRRNAHERCRRFISAPLKISPKDALRHVEARAQDISQARPEYNHATNALCVVGRRDWSRGLFLDRRAFLTSYDSRKDDARFSILFRILSAAIPVCAGINLEYYFSCVDFTKYGSGSKLPHNIVSLLGVMEGTSSDLRTGLYQQMVEIHEPLRLTFVIEASEEGMLSVMSRNAAIDGLVRRKWVHLAIIDPETSVVRTFNGHSFEPYQLCSKALPEVKSSRDCYVGSRDHLPFRSICEAQVLS